MRDTRFALLSLVLMLLSSTSLHAGDVTIRFNGFLNRSGGEVNGTGLAQPIRWEKGDEQVVLRGLQPDGRYDIDFFHNSGEASSDFTIVINDKGDGVSEVGLGGGVHQMLKDFKRGDATLTLRTFDIVYNANSGQIGIYFIEGLIDAHALPANSGPQTLRAIPGTYFVDNLLISGGQIGDYQFMIEDKGNTSAVTTTMRAVDDDHQEIVKRRWERDAAEYAQFEGPKVKPRFATVQFTLEGSGYVNFHPTYAASEVTRDGNNLTFTMPITIGNAGVNVWSFGDYTVSKTNVQMPDGKTVQGRTGTNDFHFLPRLRHNKKEGFYFATTVGPSKTIHGEATGFYDGNENPLPLTVKAAAPIIESKDAKPAATQPDS